ncbi:MAG: CDP-diacylglycerol--glycerol-3-phosphate 3-phosphatidyltransferase [Planctomycetes bacterium]|nr:CDP-diacylglycerol--glycerol-3-phosphate 3-phosphatidyltransferase [Planctomycetota bacterium]
MNLPNQITLARLILAVVFFILISRFNVRDPDPAILDVCLTLFIVACLTDWLDGYLARRNNQVTALGRVLDPFVDKVLVCGAFVFFAGAGFVDSDGRNVTAVAPWMVVVIVGRELLVTGLRGFSEAQGRPFAADVFGKIKTITQMVTASVIMLCVAHAPPDETRSLFAGAGEVLLWLTIVTTSYSGLNYLYKARNVLLDRHD